jgi:anthranilate phosphoribosyltransferase
MELTDAIARVVEGHDLTRNDASEVLRTIMSGEATPAQIGGLLVALRMKGESVDEITGFAETMRAFATRVNTSRRPLVDTCGTGGDESGSFNISTTTAFVVAGAGIAVAKHGNRAASSRCGSADVLEALGVNIEASAEEVGKSIDDIGIGFLFARTLHRAMKHVAAPRLELKIRTVFNFLGPLTNPANADGQVLGIFDVSRIEEFAYVLKQLGTRRALVVSGADGLDEISISGPTHVAEAYQGTVKTYIIEPGDVGLPTGPASALQGGNAHENAGILKAVLDGEIGPRRDIVVFNAAAAILAADGAVDWREALSRAQESIDSGAARGKLDALIARAKSRT